MRFSTATFATAALVVSSSAAPAAHLGQIGNTDLTGTIRNGLSLGGGDAGSGSGSTGSRFSWDSLASLLKPLGGGGGLALPTGLPALGGDLSSLPGLFLPGGGDIAAAPSGSLPGLGGKIPGLGGLSDLFPGGGDGAATPTRLPEAGDGYPALGGSPSSPNATPVPEVPSGDDGFPGAGSGEDYPELGGTPSSPSMTPKPEVPSEGGNGDGLESISFSFPTATDVPGNGK